MMFSPAHAQDIEVSLGPMGARVDTGSDWMDLGFVVALVALLVAAALIYRRLR